MEQCVFSVITRPKFTSVSFINNLTLLDENRSYFRRRSIGLVLTVARKFYRANHKLALKISAFWILINPKCPFQFLDVVSLVFIGMDQISVSSLYSCFSP